MCRGVNGTLKGIPMRRANLCLSVVSALCSILLTRAALPASQTTAAERLARLATEDTVAYVATSGVDELRAAFEKTVLYQFVNDPNVRSVIDKVNAVFLDGHVESLSRQAFQTRLQETYKRLGREMPR